MNDVGVIILIGMRAKMPGLWGLLYVNELFFGNKLPLKCNLILIKVTISQSSQSPSTDVNHALQKGAI